MELNGSAAVGEREMDRTFLALPNQYVSYQRVMHTSLPFRESIGVSYLVFNSLKMFDENGCLGSFMGRAAQRMGTLSFRFAQQLVSALENCCLYQSLSSCRIDPYSSQAVSDTRGFGLA